MSKKRRTIIDGDSIAYTAGYAPSPDSCIMSVNNQMGLILQNTMADGYELYIEEYRKPKNLFRAGFFDLSNRMVKEDKQGYKGNRPKKKVDVPHLDLARECLINTWNATVVTIHEAEDIVSMRYTKLVDGDKYMPMIAAIDKDLLCNQGDFYNYGKDKYYFTRVTKREAIVNKWRQVLTGDSADNIPGLPGIGAAKAAKIITNHRKAGLIAAMTYKSLGASYEYFIEQYNLIYIRTDGSTEMLYPFPKEKWNTIMQDNVDGLLDGLMSTKVFNEKYVIKTRKTLEVLFQ